MVSFEISLIFATATGENGTNYWFAPSRFNIDENLPLGTPLLLKIHAGKVVDAKIEPD